MKRRILMILLFSGFYVFFLQLKAQRIVFDAGHFAAVNENAVIRNAAELSHSEYQDRVVKSLEKINLNSLSVVAAQSLIQESLSHVNAALKQGLMVRNMAGICGDIRDYGVKMSELAKSEPYLLLFSEQIFRDMYSRSLALVSEVSEFVLKENAGLLMDYNSRDELLKRINTQLHILAGLCYGAWKAMYYAKVKGIYQSLNPFASYLNQDKALVSQVIRNAKYLKP